MADSKGNGAAGQSAWMKLKVSSRVSERWRVIQEDAGCCPTASASMCVSTAGHLCIQTTKATATSKSGTWSLCESKTDCVTGFKMPVQETDLNLCFQELGKFRPRKLPHHLARGKDNGSAAVSRRPQQQIAASPQAPQCVWTVPTDGNEVKVTSPGVPTVCFKSGL